MTAARAFASPDNFSSADEEQRAPRSGKGIGGSGSGYKPQGKGKASPYSGRKGKLASAASGGKKPGQKAKHKQALKASIQEMMADGDD